MADAALATPHPAAISTARLIALREKSRGLSLTTGVISALQSGDYQSAFKGRGMEYNESRPYQAGDDIRNIDWRVTARTGKTHTKLFSEERERPVHIWVDFRPAMFFATRGRFKSVIAAEAASLFAWAVQQQGDRVGGIVFSDEIHHELKPQRGKSSVLRLINTLVAHPAWAEDGVQPAAEAGLLQSLLALRRLARPGSLIILLSDFRGLDDEARSQLIRLRRHSEIILVHIHDRLEEQLPPAGRYRITDGQREVEIDTHDLKRVAAYRRQFSAHREMLLTLTRSTHINYLSCRTEDDPVAVIKKGLRTR